MLRAKVGAFVELHRAKQEIVRQAALLQEQEERERQRILAQLELASLRRERAAQERYRRLVDGISHAIVWTIDPATLACTFASPSAAALLAQPLERWTSGPEGWSQLVADADRARLMRTLRELGPDGDAVTLEHGLVRADGRTLRFETELRVVPAEEEGRFEVRAFSVDVTDARLAEEALSFLDRAGAALAQSLDLATTAEVAAAIGVPFLADAAVVHVAPVHELPALLAVAHRDAASAGPLRELARTVSLPPPPDDGRAELGTTPGRSSRRTGPRTPRPCSGRGRSESCPSRSAGAIGRWAPSGSSRSRARAATPRAIYGSPRSSDAAPPRRSTTLSCTATRSTR